MFGQNQFTPEQLAETKATVQQYAEDKAKLQEQINQYFEEFDKDNSEYLDRRELRHFLTFTFEKWHIRLPITDEFVDGLFREIDANKDNKLQKDELFNYCSIFIDQAWATLKTM